MIMSWLVINDHKVLTIRYLLAGTGECPSLPISQPAVCLPAATELIETCALDYSQ